MMEVYTLVTITFSLSSLASFLFFLLESSISIDADFERSSSLHDKKKKKVDKHVEGVSKLLCSC